MTIPACEVAQQQGLGQADPLELGQVQPLVGAVGPGVRVLDAGDQDAASGNSSWNAAMNGIEPPTPMSTGSVPSQAAANAARAAS